MRLPFRKYFAECLGALTLTLLVSLSLQVNIPVPTPLIAALVLGTFVYTVGSISGAHLNPAITIALATVKKIPVRDAILYILAQLIGAALAAVLSYALINSMPSLTVGNSWQVMLGEALGTFLLAFGVSSVVHGKIHSAASGFVIGSSLLLGILVAGSVSNGVLNPAVAFGIRSFSFAYLLGPIAGALLGAWSYKWLVD